MEPESVDAVVCDPPYGLKFMGKKFDALGQGAQQREWHRRWAFEALHLLKPGGHLLAFGGSRTYHHLASGIEEAGFDVRDQIMWLYGSGFPKSQNVEKAVAKVAGSDGAQSWEGWGTALKPAHEPIVVARKPFKGGTGKNVVEHGTGAINIDGCRVPYEAGGSKASNPSLRETVKGGNGGRIIATEEQSREMTPNEGGRFPANLILDEQAAALLDEQSGQRRSSGHYAQGGQGSKGESQRATSIFAPETSTTTYDDRGGASRFFYSPKAPKREREAGLTEQRVNDRFRTRRCTTCGKNVPEAGSCGCPDAEIEWVEPKPVANHHPTVKPIALMRYLCRLATPPGGLILDPFAGSGTTGIAALLEGFQFIGIELDPEGEGYADLARARIAHWAEDHADPAALR